MSSKKYLLLLAALVNAGSVLAQQGAIAPLRPISIPVTAPQLVSINLTSRAPTRPAAPTPVQPVRIVRPQPVFLLNSRIIVGSGLAKVSPQDIASVYVHKGYDAPAKWRSLTPNGIIDITLKPGAKYRLETKSLAAIARKLKLRGAITYQLEGLALEDLTLHVATADIAGVETQQTASGTVVNIHLLVPPPAVHPPGTILIRGVAGV
jgi:hypothetical protein